MCVCVCVCVCVRRGGVWYSLILKNSQLFTLVKFFNHLLKRPSLFIKGFNILYSFVLVLHFISQRVFPTISGHWVGSFSPSSLSFQLWSPIWFILYCYKSHYSVFFIWSAILLKTRIILYFGGLNSTGICFALYTKVCLKRPLKNKTKNWFSRPIIAYCRSKILKKKCSFRASCSTFDLY